MSESKINRKIIYSENSEINSTDKGSEANLFLLKLLDVEVVIALGKMDYKHAEHDILFFPIYLAFTDKNKIKKIGLFEIRSSKYKKYLDEIGNLDLGLMDDPILFKSVDKKFLLENIDENKSVLDEEFESESESESESEDGDLSQQKLKKFTLEEDDDDIDNQGETEKDYKKNKKNYVKREGDTWIKTMYMNNGYDILDNDGGGDCLFYTIRDAFNSIGMDMSVEKQRGLVADAIDKEQFNHYKKLYTQINASIQDNETKIDKLIKINRETKKEFDTIMKKLETKKIKSDGKLKKELRKKAKKIYTENTKNKSIIKQSRIENEKSVELLNDFKFMKGVKNLEKLKDIVKTCNFWADTYAINQLEIALNIKIIILQSNYYHQGRPELVLQCGDMVPEKVVKNKSFKPKYYVLVDHTGDHYKLILYKEKRIMRFHDIPYEIKNEIINKCLLSKGKNLFNYIPKFSNMIGVQLEQKKNEEPKTASEKQEKKEEEEENETMEIESTEEVEIKPSPSPEEDIDIFDDNVVFIFKSTSPNVAPGKYKSSTKSRDVWSEKLPSELKNDYDELSQIKDWRRVLSNFWPAPFIDDEGLQWQTVEHYFHAHKFMKNHKEFAEKFSLKSGSEICRDPIIAKSVGGKTGKYLDKSGDKKKYIQYRPKNITMEENFYEGTPSKAEQVMEKAQQFKYEQNELAKKVLLATKNAKLVHLQTIRGKSSELIPFHDTMRIRKKLRNVKKSVNKPELKIKIKG